MKVRTNLWVLLVVIVVFSGSAQGDLTARDFVSRCQGAVKFSEKDTINKDYDTGYCMGTFFGMSSVLNGEYICFPQGVTVKQSIRVFLKYMDDHPEKLHLQAPNLIYESLISAFPCG